MFHRVGCCLRACTTVGSDLPAAILHVRQAVRNRSSGDADRGGHLCTGRPLGRGTRERLDERTQGLRSDLVLHSARVAFSPGDSSGPTGFLDERQKGVRDLADPVTTTPSQPVLSSNDSTSACAEDRFCDGEHTASSDP